MHCMTEKQAETEIRYRLAKFLLFRLQEENLLTPEGEEATPASCCTFVSDAKHPAKTSTESAATNRSPRLTLTIFINGISHPTLRSGVVYLLILYHTAKEKQFPANRFPVKNHEAFSKSNTV